MAKRSPFIIAKRKRYSYDTKIKGKYKMERPFSDRAPIFRPSCSFRPHEAALLALDSGFGKIRRHCFYVGPCVKPISYSSGQAYSWSQAFCHPTARIQAKGGNALRLCIKCGSTRSPDQNRQRDSDQRELWAHRLQASFCCLCCGVFPQAQPDALHSDIGFVGFFAFFASAASAYIACGKLPNRSSLSALT
jgi:hypothetical protein